MHKESCDVLHREDDEATDESVAEVEELEELDGAHGDHDAQDVVEDVVVRKRGDHSERDEEGSRCYDAQNIADTHDAEHFLFAVFSQEEQFVEIDYAQNQGENVPYNFRNLPKILGLLRFPT